MSIVQQFIDDEAGFVVSSEMILLGTVVVIGLIAGMTTLRNAVTGELADIGAALGDLNQSFSYGAVTSHCGSVSGSEFRDVRDFCEISGNNDRVCSAPLCVRVCLAPISDPE